MYEKIKRKQIINKMLTVSKRSFIFLFAFVLASAYCIYPCISIVKADVQQTYFWLDKSTLHLGLDTNVRFLSNDPDVNIIWYTSNVNGLRGIGYILYKEFDTEEGANNWDPTVILNTAMNLSTTTYGNKLEFKTGYYTYYQLNEPYTKVVKYYQNYTSNFGYVYSIEGEKYFVFANQIYDGRYAYNDPLKLIALREHNVRDINLSGTNTTLDGSIITYGNIKYPFKFFGSTSANENQTDQRTTQSVDNNPLVDVTINQHPQDVWNTYHVERNVATVTNVDETYILPNAVTQNGDVISENNLNYQDVTYNTEYNVSNTNNYYGIPDSDNTNQGGDQQGGQTMAAGIQIVDSLNPIFNNDPSFTNNPSFTQSQTIEPGAASANITVDSQAVVITNTVGSDGELTEKQIDRIEQIIGLSDELSFVGAWQKLHEMGTLGNEFSKLTKAYLGFFPEWSLDVLGFAGILLGFMIVIRLFHVLHG